MSLSMAGPIFGNWQGYLLSSNLGWLGILSTSGLTLSTATANKVTGTRQRLGGMPTAFPYSSSLASGSEHRSLRMVKAMEFSEGSLIRSVGETWQPAQTQSLTFSGPGRKPHFPSPSRQQHWEKDDQDLTCGRCWNKLRIQEGLQAPCSILEIDSWAVSRRSSILRHRENIAIEELSLSCFAYYAYCPKGACCKSVGDWVAGTSPALYRVKRRGGRLSRARTYNITVMSVVQLLSSSDFFSHFRICRIRESLLRVGAFSNAQQPGEGWLPGDRLRQGPLGLLLMRLGEGIGKGLINQAGGLLGTRKRESGWRVLLS
ncbi:hypothetical protein V6N13_034960 [Hibiscus sabdariffa]|uniref:Uncharacterized protein n=1 Tax=Hibiscus sabdariffa TaxID=183260 RepID=A0ABR2AFY8_9ROSI